MEKIISDLQAVLEPGQLKVKEPMKDHTSFKVGGPADLLLIPESRDQLLAVLKILKGVNHPVFIIGNGSNLIVKDNGFRGIMIKTTGLKKVEVVGETLIAEPGISLKELADVALNAGLTGLEFASGIPGSLGGAATMNAGAYDGEMKNCIVSLEVLTEDGNIKSIPLEDCQFGYRQSVLQKNNWVLLAVTIGLNYGDQAAIRDKMQDLNQRRSDKQPLEYPSAGSTFRRPEGYYAGKLVQDAGFKGYRLGGAQVSEKHSGFVINKDNATAADILNLIAAIQNGVKEQFGVELKTEVIVIGE
ncbi:UDP-N-acetylmuramate dehydrogenase [Eubacteriaceae bacterium ES2]|nr:UDP-N-acetylmuramate dehydrogenase [Eubacteriaceae bacterium ES2]